MEGAAIHSGPPVSDLVPGEAPENSPGLLGCMAGTVAVHTDVVAPVDEQWEADA